MARKTTKVKIGNGVAAKINRGREIVEQMAELKEELDGIRTAMIAEAGSVSGDLHAEPIFLHTAKGVGVEISQDADRPVVGPRIFWRTCEERGISEVERFQAFKVSIPEARRFLGEDGIKDIATSMKPGSIKVKW